MFYQSNLQLICETLKKCHIDIAFIGTKETVNNFIDKSFLMLFGGNLDQNLTFIDFIGEAEHNTIYKMSTPLKLSYMFFLLPKSSQDTVMLIGPYTDASLSDEEILEIGERNNISPHNQKLLKAYYDNAPIILNNSPIMAMLESFGEYVWGSNNFTVVDFSRDLPAEVLLLSSNNTTEELSDVLINMNIMEKRYSFENEIFEAVSMGQSHKIDHLMSLFASTPFEKRNADPLRNIKNYCIIMNTLLRKAAEKGQVHPLYLNGLSSTYGTKIEQQTSVDDATNLMSEMLHSYCRLVRKHSMKNYSSVVQKAIMCINSDLSANLTLSTLAETQNISAGYLSTLFKKETGKTVTEFITEKRVKRAKELLSTTKLQIQTVALHCGIIDVHYFSKIFKKYTGKTPKEYRESVR